MNLKCEKAVRQTADNFRQFSRNGRWGTCADCPRDSLGAAYPEFCRETSRYDHALNVDQLVSNYKIVLERSTLTT
jgi:hypothetical protein